MQRPYFTAQDSTPAPQNVANVFRRNAGASNSGFVVGASASNVLVEGSVFRQSDRCVTVDGATDLVWVRGSDCSVTA